MRSHGIQALHNRFREARKPDSVITPSSLFAFNIDASGTVHDNASVGSCSRGDCPFHIRSSLLLSHAVNSAYVLFCVCGKTKKAPAITRRRLPSVPDSMPVWTFLYSNTTVVMDLPPGTSRIVS